VAFEKFYAKSGNMLTSPFNQRRSRKENHVRIFVSSYKKRNYTSIG